MSGSLVDPLAKLTRAKDHLLALDKMLPKPGVGQFRAVRAELQDDGREYRFYVGTLPSLDTELIAVMFGDLLFNLRASLDHLVYQLHVRRFRGSVPAAIEGATAFPLKANEPGKKEKWGQIAALSAEHRTAIKHLQPYQRRHDRWAETRQVLGMLDKLNNIDKHRHLHVARRMPHGFPLPNVPRDCGFVHTPAWGPLESDAEVARWTFTGYVPDDIAKQVKMNNYVIVDVTLEEPEAGLVHAPGLVILGRVLWERVKRVLRRFARWFPPIDFPALPV